MVQVTFKMVHNGIEYGDMQLICEAYQVMRDLLHMSADEMHDVFTEWNKGDRKSGSAGMPRPRS